MIKIRIGGWAGQGTVLAGTVLARALAIEQGYHAVQKRSYSAAVRSGIASSDVIVDESPVDELNIDVPDYLMILYQKTLDAWRETAEQSGTIILDSSRVKGDITCEGETYRLPAGEIADELGSSQAANMVLIGALSKVEKSIELEALKKAVKQNFSEEYIDLNIAALGGGHDRMENPQNFNSSKS